MKKLLGATVAIAMGATMVVGMFTACNTGDDVEKAKEAINNVRKMYIEDAKETSENYSVTGKIKIKDGTSYDVDWTVLPDASCTIENFSNYVSVGEMGTDSKVTISITKAEVVIDYVLKASVTVGKATESVEFKHFVPKTADSHAGTEADPYIPSNVRDIAATLDSKWDTTANQTQSQSYFYPNNDTPAEVYVKGYIVKVGTSDLCKDYGEYVSFIYIADEYGTGKTKDDSDVVMIASISYNADSLVKSVDDIVEGHCITVKGYIQNYFAKNSTATATPQPEISRWKDASNTYHDVEVKSLVDGRTDAQKIEDAKAAVTLGETYTAGTHTLPLESNGATLSWAVKSGADVTIEGANMTVTAPSEAHEVTLTVTISCGTATPDTKDITITVDKASEKGTEAQPYTVAEAKAILNTLASGETYQVNGVDAKVYIHGFVTDSGTVSNFGVNNVYIADTKEATQDNSALIYSINWSKDGGVFIKDRDELDVGDEITLFGFLKNFKGTEEIADGMVGGVKTYPEITAITKVVLTDAQKVTKALKAVSATLPVITEVGETSLPTTTKVDGVTLTWSTEDTTYTVTDNKLNVAALPTDADATVTLKVTATCNEAHEDKTVTVVVKKPLGENIAVIDFTTIAKGNELTADAAKTLLETCGAKNLTAVTEISKVYQGNAQGGGTYENAGGLIKFGTGSVNGKLSLTFSKKVTKVTINCTGWKASDKINVNSGTAITLEALAATGTDREFTLATASETVTIETTTRALIFKITVEFEADTPAA